MSEAKTVAIIGAGPVGLAAAAHVLERGLRPIVLEAGDGAGHAVRQWGHVQLFSPWEYNIDRAAARLLAPTGWNSPEPDQYPTGAELVERYLEPLATKTVLATHIQTNSRVTDISRVGFDKLKTRGREAAPFEIRYQNGQGPKVVRADAVIDASGTWHSPNPAGANGLPAIGETAGRRQDRLRHAGRAGQGPRALCRQDGRGAGRRTFGDRHPHRSRAACGTSAGNQADLAVARQRSRKSLRRRRQRQARRPRRTRRRLRRAGRGGPGQGGKRISRFASDRSTALASSSAPARPAAAVTSPSTNSSWRRVSGPIWISCANFASQLDPAIECPVALAPLIDPERTQLRHGAAARRARTGAGRTRLLFRRHEILRPRADLPDDHRIRAGALDCRRNRRRPRGRGARRTGAARDRRLQSFGRAGCE